jgi:hypothetical protein
MIRIMSAQCQNMIPKFSSAYAFAKSGSYEGILKKPLRILLA